MDRTPTPSVFDAAYQSYSAPWVIGKPQPAVVELEAPHHGHAQLRRICPRSEHCERVCRCYGPAAIGHLELGEDRTEMALDGGTVMVRRAAMYAFVKASDHQPQPLTRRTPRHRDIPRHLPLKWKSRKTITFVRELADAPRVAVCTWIS